MSATEIIAELPRLSAADFRAVKVKVLEMAPQTPDVDLRALRMSETEAADLRGRLSAFAEDWERPEMDIYDEDPAR